MKKIYFVIAAVAMMMAGCEKQAENENTVNSMNSFDLNVQGFSDASGAKTHWSDAGLWWNEDGSDYLVINGVSFQVKKEGDKWKAISTVGVGPDNGNFYVAYPYNGSNYDQNNHTYGPVEFDDGTKIPLAAVTTSNSITLYPCCAVIKGASSVSFFGSDGNPGTVYGKVYYQADINIDNATLENGIALDEATGSYDLYDDGNGYIIIPIEGDYVEAVLEVDGNRTSDAVTLRKGRIYVIGAKN